MTRWVVLETMGPVGKSEDERYSKEKSYKVDGKGDAK
jgi:hypothetical protein